MLVVSRLCFSKPGGRLSVSQNHKGRHSAVVSLLLLPHIYCNGKDFFLILARPEWRKHTVMFSHRVCQTCAVCFSTVIAPWHTCGHTFSFGESPPGRTGHRGDEEWHSEANQLLVVWLSNSSPVNCLKATSVCHVPGLAGRDRKRVAVFQWSRMLCVRFAVDALAGDFREVWPGRAGTRRPEITRGRSDAVLEQHFQTWGWTVKSLSPTW